MKSSSLHDLVYVSICLTAAVHIEAQAGIPHLTEVPDPIYQFRISYHPKSNSQILRYDKETD